MLCRLPIFTSNPSETIFFLVTNIEYDVVSNEDSKSPPDTYIGSTIGELGCWIDPQTTRIIQTGLEQSRVPDVTSRTRTGKTVVAAFYRSLREQSSDTRSPRALLSSFAKQAYSHILCPDSPYGKLYKVISAALLKNAAEYRLHLSLLLKGPRGVGKTSTATWVSQSLGVHLLDVTLAACDFFSRTDCSG
jgi:peroxin-6